MKEIPYLTHDLGARNDPKLIELQMEMGGQGLAIYWCLVEMLWENEGYLPMNPRSLAYQLRWANAEEVQRVITDFDLFVLDEDDRFHSRSALERIDDKRRRINAKADAGRKGGLATQSDRAEMKQSLSTAKAELKQSQSAAKPLTNLPTNLHTNSLSQDAPAQERVREEGLEDLFFEIFFKRDFISPAEEVRRALKYCDENEVKDPRKLAESWAPENKTPRFNDPDILNWCDMLQREIAARAVLPEGVEFLRAIDAITVDKRNRILKVRMFTQDWGEVVASLVNEWPSLRVPYDKVQVFKRNPETL